MLEGMPSPRICICTGPPGGCGAGGLDGGRRVRRDRPGDAEHGDRDAAAGGVSRLAGRGGVRADADVCGAAEVRGGAGWRGGAGRAGRPRPPRALGEDKRDLARQWREQGDRIWRSAGGWAWRGPRWPAAWPRAGGGGRCRCRGRRSLSSRNLAGTRHWLRNRSRSQGRRQIQGRSSKRNRSPETGPGWQPSRGRERLPARRGTGRRRSAAAGAGRAGDHRRGVLVAVCGGDAAARVHGPGRGGAGAGVRRRRRARRWPGGSPMWRCCRRPACASRWGLRRSSRSST